MNQGTVKGMIGKTENGCSMGSIPYTENWGGCTLQVKPIAGTNTESMEDNGGASVEAPPLVTYLEPASRQ
jgi:hypothetical protein